MRIDLFLKVSGLLKTRSIASRAIGSGAVKLNGVRTKASASVEEGSVIELVIPDGTELTLKVLVVPKNTNVSRKDRKLLYSVLNREG
jgi:ribosomal 50S subunit-recycling heat shock protein